MRRCSIWFRLLVAFLFALSSGMVVPIPVAAAADAPAPAQWEPLGEARVQRAGPLQVYRLPGGEMGPFDLISDGRRLWVTVQKQRGILRVDPTSRRVAFWQAPDGVYPYTLALGPEGAVWAADFEFENRERPRSVLRFDPRTGAVDVFRLPEPTDGVTDFAFAADGSVWLANYQSRGVLRLDPGTGSFERYATELPPDTQRTVFTGVLRLTIDDGEVWGAESVLDRVFRLRWRSGRAIIESYPLPMGFNAPVAVFIDEEGALWTTEHAGDRILRWRAPSGPAQAYHLWPMNPNDYPVAGPNDLFPARDGSLWTVVHFAGRLSRIFADDGTVNEYFLPPVFGVGSVEVLPLWGDEGPAGDIWAAVYGQDALVRVPAGAYAGRVRLDAAEVRLQAGGPAVRVSGTFSPERGVRFPETWSPLEPAVAGADLPQEVRVRVAKPLTDAQAGGDFAVELRASRLAAPGEYPVVVGVRNGYFAAHRTITVKIAPGVSTTSLAVVAFGVGLLWAGAVLWAWMSGAK